VAKKSGTPGAKQQQQMKYGGSHFFVLKRVRFVFRENFFFCHIFTFWNAFGIFVRRKYEPGANPTTSKFTTTALAL
jgi:hypothetical protein